MSHSTPTVSLFLPNIRSAYNVGSFFRTCDGLGIDHIYLAGYTAFPPHKQVAKTALGAEDMVSWSHHPDILDSLREIKSQGIRIVVLELCEDAIELKKITPQFPLCLVVGHEVEGVSEEVLKLADEKVFIPMQGGKESLNVAVAGSIALWEIVSHRS